MKFPAGNKKIEKDKITVHKMIRSKRRTFSLEITADAHLVVRVPERASLRAINEILSQKRSWIQSRQKMVQAKLQEFAPKIFAEGESFLYLGQWYKLCLSDQKQPLTLEGEFRLSRRCVGREKEVFVEWYREEAESILRDRAQQYAQKAGLRYQDIQISNAKKRWGSCSPDGRLRFNWRLIMAPLEVLDYVVCHELAHLEEKNHSTRFWGNVRILFPDYRKQRDWLKHNQHLLRF